MKRKALPTSPLAALGAKPKRGKRPASKPGKPTPEAPRRRRTVYLAPDVDRALRLYAAAHDAELSELITEAVRVYLAAHK